MAREFKIKTVTGTESIADLHLTITNVFQDLLSKFTYAELLESDDLNALISNANIVTEDESGDSIASFGNTQNDALTIAGVQVDDSNKANGRILKYNNTTGKLEYQDESSGGANSIACCPFGAKSDGIGNFLIANGRSTDADDSSKAKTRHPIALSGTLTKLAYKTKDGDSTTQMKVHVNGTVAATVVLSSINSNDGGIESINISVSAGDYVEIEYDANQKPGECTMYFIQEL